MPGVRSTIRAQLDLRHTLGGLQHGRGDPTTRVSRQEVWRKGDTSGEVQVVREASYDCDGDTLLFLVDQQGGGACHTGNRSCFFRSFGAGDAPGPDATS